MLSTEQLGKLREALQAERTRLAKSGSDGLAFSMNRDRNIGRDSIDESMEEELFSTEMRLRDREKGLLNKINSAIDRLERGVIDECEDCSESIGFRRLIARPVTTLCIDCKEEREADERAEGTGRGDDAVGGLGGAGDDDAPPAATEE